MTNHIFLFFCRTPNSNCPIDNKPLTYENDIFPDNFTKREINQIRPHQPCPNINNGCQLNLSPHEMETHILECSFKDRMTLTTSSCHDCPFRQYGCKTKTIIDRKTLDEHIEKEFTIHLTLLMTAFTQKQQQTIFTDTTTTTMVDNNKLWDPPNKNQSSNETEFNKKTTNNNDLIKGMYERIVVLEQSNREQNHKIEKLNQHVNKLLSQQDVVDPKYSNGVIVWRITQFRSKIDAMNANPNIMFYSNESFTSPYGYKFCARINISPKVKDFIGLHIHLMRSTNDFHLDWPFRGRIKINLIHPNDLSQSQHDTIMSKPDILAFHRPTQDISPRGFGFLEYASVSDIYRYFIVNDTITIKIQLNIV